MERKYSVLMSLYHKESPNALIQSVDSMLDQSILPDEIIIMKDGPLTDDLDKALTKYEDNPIIKLISLKENVGLGKALNIGLEYCKNNIIVRMDTDDVSEPNRCQIQLSFLNDHKDISIVGTAVSEFVDHEDNIVALKEVLEKHDDIKKQIKFRNPMNHPTVMFRKKDILAVGSYQHWHLNEDYYLWLRLMKNGYKFANLNEPFVKMRITDDTYLRRGGYKYFVAQKKMQDYMLQEKMINVFEYIYNVSIRFVARVLLPNRVRKQLYLNLLRKKQ